jgi:hypothetical protein
LPQRRAPRASGAIISGYRGWYWLDGRRADDRRRHRLPP